MAIKKLKALGNGFTVIPVAGKYLIQSVPGEMTMDHTTILQQAEV
jgi:ESCRT-II complex subunit VPS22